MKPSTTELVSDARAQLRWQSIVFGVGLAVSYLLAMRRLGDPDTMGGARLFWVALPFAFFLGVAWEARRRWERQSEFELEVVRRASTISFHFTVCWLFALALLDAAIGLPAELLPGE